MGMAMRMTEQANESAMELKGLFRNLGLATSLLLAGSAQAQEAARLKELGKPLASCSTIQADACRNDISANFAEFKFQITQGREKHSKHKTDVSLLSNATKATELCNASAEWVNDSIKDIAMVWTYLSKKPPETWPVQARGLFDEVRAYADPTKKTYADDKALMAYMSTMISDAQRDPRKCGRLAIFKTTARQFSGSIEKLQRNSLSILEGIAEMLQEASKTDIQARAASLAFFRAMSNVTTIQSERRLRR
ncbi:MAG: hypothetical protein G01um10148_891 [Parcubacteria group bacterium Gr01-1014_8]|nr:MAG: hypothetical protein G01um10148_891 [Parcubacteria group bacterium Gr01-1014_8]